MDNNYSKDIVFHLINTQNKYVDHEDICSDCETNHYGAGITNLFINGISVNELQYADIIEFNWVVEFLNQKKSYLLAVILKNEILQQYL